MPNHDIIVNVNMETLRLTAYILHNEQKPQRSFYAKSIRDNLKSTNRGNIVLGVAGEFGRGDLAIDATKTTIINRTAPNYVPLLGEYERLTVVNARFHLRV